MKNLAGKTVLSLALVVLTAGLSWLIHWEAPQPQATWDDVRAEALAGGYELISTGELKKRLDENEPDLLVIDTRQAWEYRTGHIAGAVNFPMEPTWRARWLKKGQLKKLIGPDKNRPVVFY